MDKGILFNRGTGVWTCQNCFNQGKEAPPIVCPYCGLDTRKDKKEQDKNIVINTNAYCKVRLTPFGEQALLSYYLRIYGREDRARDSILNSHVKDNTGELRFKLYELLDIFGHTSFHSNSGFPFVNNEIIFGSQPSRGLVKEV
jgi:hypothetical protein